VELAVLTVTIHSLQLHRPHILTPIRRPLHHTRYEILIPVRLPHPQHPRTPRPISQLKTSTICSAALAAIAHKSGQWSGLEAPVIPQCQKYCVLVAFRRVVKIMRVMKCDRRRSLSQPCHQHQQSPKYKISLRLELYKRS